jgi:hypothetical protein
MTVERRDEKRDAGATAQRRDEKRDEGATAQPLDDKPNDGAGAQPPDDIWEAARAAQREDVRAAFAPRERVCPSCGATESGPGRYCSNCGADLTARLPRWRSLRKWAIAGVAVLVLAAISVPIVGALRDDAAEHRERAEARQAALEAAERERLTIDARPVRAEGAPLREGDDPLTTVPRSWRRASG